MSGIEASCPSTPSTNTMCSSLLTTSEACWRSEWPLLHCQKNKNTVTKDGHSCLKIVIQHVKNSMCLLHSSLPWNLVLPLNYNPNYQNNEILNIYWIIFSKAESVSVHDYLKTFLHSLVRTSKNHSPSAPSPCRNHAPWWLLSDPLGYRYTPVDLEPSMCCWNLKVQRAKSSSHTVLHPWRSPWSGTKHTPGPTEDLRQHSDLALLTYSSFLTSECSVR